MRASRRPPSVLLFLLAVAIGTVLGGPIGDRIGTKRTVVLGLGILTLVLLSYASMTIMSSVLWGSLVRVVFGLGMGLTLMLAFGLPPVLQLAQVPPLRVIRRDVGGLKPASAAVLTVPVALFTTVARTMGPPQWSDLGMFLQSVMLMLREEGLDSCAQECWAIYPETIRGFLGTPTERMLFCGMAIGHADTSAPVNTLHSARAPLEEFAHFRGI